MKIHKFFWYGLATGAACAIIGLTAWFFMSNESIDASIKLPPGVPRSNVVAFWPADGNAADIVGGHNCVLQNGASFSDGIAGRAFELDNTAGINGGQASRVFPPPAFDGGAYVQAPKSDAWAFGTKDFTIELWAKFNSVPVHDIGHAQGGIFISNDEGAYDVNKWWFALGGGVLNFHINDPKDGPVWLVNAPFTPDLNQWYHLAITRKHNVFTIYVNGEATGSEENDRSIPETNSPLLIGSAEGYYFNGLLEEAGIFKRALSASEIMSIYNARGQH
jgi:hypothetical protein